MKNRTLRSMFLTAEYDRTTIFDFSNKNTMTQDLEGLVPLTAVGQRAGRVYPVTRNSVGYSENYNQLSNSALGVCPTYREDTNGVGYLEFTGTEYLTMWKPCGCMNAMVAIQMDDPTSNVLGNVAQATGAIEFAFSGDYTNSRWYYDVAGLALTTRLWSNLTQTRSITVGKRKIYTADGSGKWTTNVKFRDGVLVGAHPLSADNFVGRMYGVYLYGDSTADVWPTIDRESKIRAFAAKYGITI